MRPRWRKYTISGGLFVSWRLKVGRFEGEVCDKLSSGEGYIGYVNDIRVTQKFQRTLRQAKVIVLLVIRKECKDMLELIEHMDTKY